MSTPQNSDWDKYKTATATDMTGQGNTFQTTEQVTDGTGNTNILDNFRVDDVDGKKVQQYSSSPETTTASKDSKTGSGLEAALGTDYSWNTKASDRANLDYEAAVLESKQNYLTNRQELESQGQQLQQQVAMQKYSQNQSNEKAGWTGGYVLDTERQMEYLKQTIQSQMYGAIELQKYGYDTSLAAARLAYDTNKYDLALEYYNTALSRAISEAEITGYYVSPETAEMLNEYSIASRVLNDATASEEDKLRADRVLSSVYKWFEDNGISKQGVMTMSKYESERNWNQALLNSFEYIDETTNQITGDKFVKYGADGKPVYSEDGSQVQTINFKTMSSQEILDYIAINDICKEQFYGYLDNKMTGEMAVKFEDWCIANNKMSKNEDGTYSPINNTDYQSLIITFLQSSQAYKSLTEKLSIDETGMSTTFQALLENYDFNIDLPDGTTLTTTFKELTKQKIENANALTNGKLEDLIRQATDADGNVLSNEDGSKKYANTIDLEQRNVTIEGNTFESTYVADANLYFTSLRINENKTESEDDITLSSGIGDKYNLELNETLSNKQQMDIKTRDNLLELYKREFGTDMPDKTVIVYNDTMYVYRTKDSYNSTTKKYETKSGFLQIKGQCNGDTDRPAEFIAELNKTWGVQ